MEAVVIFVENFWRVIEDKQNTIVEVIAVNMMLLNDDFGSGDMHCLGGNFNFLLSKHNNHLFVCMFENCNTL